MWKQKKVWAKAAVVWAAVAVIGIKSGILASARDTDYTREELEQKFWGDAWERSDPGEENPEGSLEWYILESFLDEYYGIIDYDVVFDWSSSYLIRDAYEEYYEEYTKYWDYDDDEETGEFIISKRNPDAETYEEEWTNELFYTFELIDGMWNMIDVNGNTVLTFEPHGGDGSYRALVESERESSVEDDEDDESEASASDSTSDSSRSSSSQSSSESSSISSSNRVTGMLDANTSNAEESSVATEATSEIDTEESSSAAPYVIGGIVLVGVIVGGIFVYQKKK